MSFAAPTPNLPLPLQFGMVEKTSQLVTRSWQPWYLQIERLSLSGVTVPGYVVFVDSRPTTVQTIPAGDVTLNVVSIDATDSPYTVPLAVDTVLVDASAGVVTVKLQNTAHPSKTMAVKKIDASGNAVTVDGNGWPIDGAATRALAAQWDALLMQNFGTNYYRVGVV